jgi:hypothetical protein
LIFAKALRSTEPLTTLRAQLPQLLDRAGAELSG